MTEGKRVVIKPTRPEVLYLSEVNPGTGAAIDAFVLRSEPSEWVRYSAAAVRPYVVRWVLYVRCM